MTMPKGDTATTTSPDRAGAVSRATATPPTIRPMTPEDWPAVRRIFEEGIATGNATFETTAPDRETRDAGHLGEPRLVATSPARSSAGPR